MKKNIEFLQIKDRAYMKTGHRTKWVPFVERLLFLKLILRTLLSLQQNRLRRRYATWGMVLLAGFLLSGTAVYLALFSSSVTADYSLPPRDPLAQGVTTTSSVGDSGGVRIYLRGAFEQNWPWEQMHWQEDLWHMIEWQDQSGEWIKVEGWQGQFDMVYQGESHMIGQKEFWADNALLGSGPFRWRVYETGNGRLMATSPSFMLPAEKNQDVAVPLELYAK